MILATLLAGILVGAGLMRLALRPLIAAGTKDANDLCEAYRRVAESHTVEWRWPEAPEVRWVPVTDLTDRYYEMSMGENLAALEKDLAALPKDQHVSLTLTIKAPGMWAAYYMRAQGYSVRNTDYATNHLDLLKTTHRGPPAEVMSEIVTRLKDQSLYFWVKKDNSEVWMWRSVTSPLLFHVSVASREVVTPPARPEIRFVEVQVAAPAVKRLEIQGDLQEQIAARVEIEVATALARGRGGAK